MARPTVPALLVLAAYTLRCLAQSCSLATLAGGYTINMNYPLAQSEMGSSGNLVEWFDYDVSGNYRFTTWDVSTGQFNSRPLPTNPIGKWHSQGSAAMLGTAVFFAGGFDSTSSLASNVTALDTLSSSYSQMPPLSEARTSMASTVVGNVIVFAGGLVHLTVSSAIDVYTCTSVHPPTCTHLARRFSSPRYAMAVVVVGTKIWYGGGYTGTWEDGAVDIVDIYDVVGDSWSKTQLGAPRGSMGGGLAGGKVMFAGGSSHLVDVDNVDIFDASTAQLLSQQNLPAARTNIAASGAGDLIIVAGGRFTSSYTSYPSFQAYNTTSGLWSPVRALTGGADCAFWSAYTFGNQIVLNSVLPTPNAAFQIFDVTKPFVGCPFADGSTPVPTTEPPPTAPPTAAPLPTLPTPAPTPSQAPTTTAQPGTSTGSPPTTGSLTTSSPTTASPATTGSPPLTTTTGSPTTGAQPTTGNTDSTEPPQGKAAAKPKLVVIIGAAVGGLVVLGAVVLIVMGVLGKLNCLFQSCIPKSEIVP